MDIGKELTIKKFDCRLSTILVQEGLAGFSSVKRNLLVNPDRQVQGVKHW